MEDGARGLISIPIMLNLGSESSLVKLLEKFSTWAYVTSIAVCTISEDSSSSAAEQDGKDESNELGEPEVGDIVLVSSSAHDTCFAHTLQLVVKDGLKEMGANKRVHSKLATIVSQSSLDRRMSK